MQSKLESGSCLLCSFTYYFICELNVFPSFSFAVPPSKPTIFDETGREVKDLVGPYLEGETIVLKCITSGGKSLSLLDSIQGLNFNFLKVLYQSVILATDQNLLRTEVRGDFDIQGNQVFFMMLFSIKNMKY